MVSLAWAGMKAQQTQIDALKMSVEELEKKIADIGDPLLGGVANESSLFGADFRLLLQGLRGLGSIFENGVAKFQSVITKSLAIEKATDATQSAVGEAMIRAGNTVIIVPSKLVKETSQIFLTPKTPLAQSLAVTGIIEGESFKVELAEKEYKDIHFNWWIVGVTEEQTQNQETSPQPSPSQGEGAGEVSPQAEPAPEDNFSSQMRGGTEGGVLNSNNTSPSPSSTEEGGVDALIPPVIETVPEPTPEAASILEEQSNEETIPEE